MYKEGQRYILARKKNPNVYAILDRFVGNSCVSSPLSLSILRKLHSIFASGTMERFRKSARTDLRGILALFEGKNRI